MTQLTGTELVMVLSATAFGIIFFIVVSVAIFLFFKRLQRQEKATTREDEQD